MKGGKTGLEGKDIPSIKVVKSSKQYQLDTSKKQNNAFTGTNNLGKSHTSSLGTKKRMNAIHWLA